MEYVTDALILHSMKYKEADGILTLLTKERGKVSAIAKSIYKPESKLRMGVQPFSEAHMYIAAGKSNLHTIRQTEPVEMFNELRKDYDSMAYASYWAELLSVFSTEDNKDESLYLLGKAGFTLISIKPNHLTLRCLEIKLLNILGFGINLEDTHPTAGTLGLLNGITTLPLDKLTRISATNDQINELFSLTKQSIQAITGKSLKSWNQISKL